MDLRLHPRSVAPAKGPEKSGPSRPTRSGYSCNNAALDSDFEYHDTFAAARSWTLMFTGKYAFDN